MGTVLKGQDALFAWTKRITNGAKNVKVENFTSSWRDGLAFCGDVLTFLCSHCFWWQWTALIYAYHPECFDFYALNPEEPEKNLTLAFTIGEKVTSKEDTCRWWEMEKCHEIESCSLE